MASPLQSRWTALYAKTLPQLARAKDPSQASWPVSLDHCFARIILDAVVGSSSTREPPVPWTAKLKSPAVKNMTEDQLRKCISLGEAIASGSANLVDLDEKSLAARGKASKAKRKRVDEASPSDISSPRKEPKTKSQIQTDHRSAMNSPLYMASAPAPAHVDKKIASEITSHPTLTPYRRHVFLALLQVPPDQYTTYLAISEFLNSSPRAVGNAMRNNPFAPRVPCHRVVANDQSIGGFGGEWGVKGKWNEKKVALLRAEGVSVDQDGGRVRGKIWKNFA